MTNDEYTCLMIMGEGQNLIRMRDTRWWGALNSLEAKGWCKPIGNENFVITEQGRAALAGHEETLDGELRRTLTVQSRIQENQRAMHAKMQEAIAALVSAAQIAALTTGESEGTCFNKLVAEITLRARDQLNASPMQQKLEDRR